jgi:hypothetical protein
VPNRLQDIIWFGALFFILLIAGGAAALVFKDLGEKPFGGVLVNNPVTTPLLGAAATAVAALGVRLGWRSVRGAMLAPVLVLMPTVEEMARTMNEMKTTVSDLRTEMNEDRKLVQERLLLHDRQINELRRM